ncbi:zinc-binding dehydrogenase [Actinokineospora fastidiosa]|uniref:NADPH:quinone reductase n=1 Tax=Actinokineospora fastidiosa TaxID=1816 RepID=A0A918GDH4_9PSEU|nr:zinc-binding dehydrogenase [Actinokineospora fastidiosa]GGS30678.1 NADPH:quinone reductase [Actinokineospora fastidiosa]
MLAVRAVAFGGPEVLVPGEAPVPVPGAGQVVVAVSDVDVLFLDTQIRGGWGEQFGLTPPFVPGGAVAGHVAAVGPGVDPAWAGRAVAARTVHFGGYAEHALVAEQALVAVPDGVGLAEAAALQHDGPTAVGLFDGAEIQPGEWVLITGAAGGMGVLLVQLARSAGARVIAAARGARKLKEVENLGAEVVVDYSTNWLDRLHEATDGTGPQVVFDGVGGDLGAAAFTATARGGRFSAHGAASGGFAPIDPREAERRGIRVRGIEQAQFTTEEAKRLTERALSDAAAGRIRPLIGQTFPLTAAADAHAAIEARQTLGKTLLQVSPTR